MIAGTTAQGLAGVCAPPALTHGADHVATTAGTANGERVWRWFREKKAGGYAVLADPQMPVIRTLLDQAHNTIERKMFMMKALHHPDGGQQALSPGSRPSPPWSLISVGRSMPVDAAWKWKADTSRHATRSSICTSLPQAAFAEP